MNIKPSALPFIAVVARYLLLPVALLCQGSIANAIYAQKTAKNALYMEGATRGPVYSVNYDRRLKQGGRVDYSLRAGFSVSGNKVSLPLGLNMITGRGEHHAEFGLSVIPQIDYKDHLIGRNEDRSDKYIFVNPGIGYRYQKPGKGIFLKASAGPSVFLDPPAGDFWNMDPKLYAFAAIGVGFSF